MSVNGYPTFHTRGMSIVSRSMSKLCSLSPGVLQLSGMWPHRAVTLTHICFRDLCDSLSVDIAWFQTPQWRLKDSSDFLFINSIFAFSVPAAEFEFTVLICDWSFVLTFYGFSSLSLIQYLTLNSAQRRKTTCGLVLHHTCDQTCLLTVHCFIVCCKASLVACTAFQQQIFLPCLIPCLQVNLAIMQKQLSEMAIGHPRQSGSSSRQNGFSGGVGALGIMNNRLAETSVDR